MGSEISKNTRVILRSRVFLSVVILIAALMPAADALGVRLKKEQTAGTDGAGRHEADKHADGKGRDNRDDKAAGAGGSIATVTPPETSSERSGGGECVCNWSDIAERALPAVVNISSTQMIENSRVFGDFMPQAPGGSFLEEMFREFMEPRERAQRKVQSLGSGFIIEADGNQALVVSNYHVIANAKSIKVILHDKTEVEGTVLHADERSDIAVIKISTKGLANNSIAVLQWGDSGKTRVAQEVMAIGNPFGFGSTVTTGVISHKGRYMPSNVSQDIEYLQHSAQINMGNSGGCLLNKNGQVIGINTAIISPSGNGGNVGIGFAIPSNVARRVISQLKQYGYTRRGYLGVHIQTLTDRLREGMNLGNRDQGVLVGSIDEDGPAKGLIQPQDIIMEYDGKPVSEPQHLSRLVGETEVGSAVKIKVLRNKEPVTVEVTIAELPHKKEKEPGKDPKSKEETIEVEGIRVSPIPEEIRKKIQENKKRVINGVLVVDINRRQGLDEMDLLQRGDIIIEAHQMPIHTPKDFADAVARAKQDKRENILLYIMKNQKDRMFCPLPLEKGDNREAARDEAAKESRAEADKD